MNSKASALSDEELFAADNSRGLLDPKLFGSPTSTISQFAQRSRLFRLNSVGLAIGLIGMAAIFGFIRWTDFAVGEHAGRIAFIVMIAFLGLTLVALLGMVGSHVEHSAAMRFTQLQAELDLAEFAERGRIATHSLASIKTILSSSSLGEQRVVAVMTALDLTSDLLVGVDASDLTRALANFGSIARSNNIPEEAISNIESLFEEFQHAGLPSLGKQHG